MGALLRDYGIRAVVTKFIVSGHRPHLNSLLLLALLIELKGWCTCAVLPHTSWFCRENVVVSDYCCRFPPYFSLVNHGGWRMLLSLRFIHWNSRWQYWSSVHQCYLSVWTIIYKRKCSCVAGPGQKKECASAKWNIVQVLYVGSFMKWGCPW